MNYNEFFIVMEFLLFVLLFDLFWFFIWKRFALDWFRQKLFDIRDELFDSVAEIESKYFNSYSYKIFREVLNGTIRFAHTLTPVRIFMYEKLKIKTMQDTYKFDFNDIANDKLKSKFLRLKNDYFKTIVVYFWLSSPLFIVYSILIIVIATIRTFWDFLKGQRRFLPQEIKNEFKEKVEDVPQQALEEAKLVYN